MVAIVVIFAFAACVAGIAYTLLAGTYEGRPVPPPNEKRLS